MSFRQHGGVKTKIERLIGNRARTIRLKKTNVFQMPELFQVSEDSPKNRMGLGWVSGSDFFNLIEKPKVPISCFLDDIDSISNIFKNL